MTWLSSLFALIGGGPVTTGALCFVVLSDITPQAKRAGTFLRVGAFNMFAQLVMPPLAAWLMAYNPSIPTFGGTVLMILSAILVILIPETLNFQQEAQIPPPYSEVVAQDLGQSPTDTLANSRPMAIVSTRSWLAKLKRSASSLTKDYRIPILILPFLVHQLIGMNNPLLLQYLGKRYGLTFSKATLLMTIRSGVIVLLMFVILPYLSTAAHKRLGLSVQRKDLYLARMSQAFVAIGWILVGLSPNIPLVAISLAIGSLGQGATFLIRSFLTSLLPSHHIARVYSVISVVDTLGAMIGSPLLAGLFKRGLALGGGWVGLCYYFIGFLSVLVLSLLCTVGLRKGEDGYSPVEGDE